MYEQQVRFYLFSTSLALNIITGKSTLPVSIGIMASVLAGGNGGGDEILDLAFESTR